MTPDQPGSPRKFTRPGILFDFGLIAILAAWFFTPHLVPWLAGDAKDAGAYGDMFGALNTLFSGLAFFGVACNLYLQRQDNERHWRHQKREKDDENSLFYMNSAIDGYKQAQGLLETGSNDRALWIEAARVITHARSFADLVTNDAHKKVLELSLLRFRTFFHGHLSSQSASFFYGTTHADMIEAAKASSIDPMVGTTRIPPESIRAVWLAAQFPPEYTESLGPTFTETERDRLGILFRGVEAYLTHTEKYWSFRGILKNRQTGDTH